MAHLSSVCIYYYYCLQCLYSYPEQLSRSWVWVLQYLSLTSTGWCKPLPNLMFLLTKDWFNLTVLNYSCNTADLSLRYKLSHDILFPRDWKQGGRCLSKSYSGTSRGEEEEHGFGWKIEEANNQNKHIFLKLNWQLIFLKTTLLNLQNLFKWRLKRAA